MEYKKYKPQIQKILKAFKASETGPSPIGLMFFDNNPDFLVLDEPVKTLFRKLLFAVFATCDTDILSVTAHHLESNIFALSIQESIDKKSLNYLFNEPFGWLNDRLPNEENLTTLAYRLGRSYGFMVNYAAIKAYIAALKVMLGIRADLDFLAVRCGIENTALTYRGKSAVDIKRQFYALKEHNFEDYLVYISSLIGEHNKRAHTEYPVIELSQFMASAATVKALIESDLDPNVFRSSKIDVINTSLRLWNDYGRYKKGRYE